MRILPLSLRLNQYLTRRNLERSFLKCARLFAVNPLHPSLHTELLEPKHMRVYSFRITRSHRAIFVYCGNDTIEIIDINNHYQ